jgi:hypothetical protein
MFETSFDQTNIPPLVDSGSTLYLTRHWATQVVTLLLPNGDTYDLEVEDTKRYLKLVGMAQERIEAALDYLWNFHAIKLQPSTGLFFWVPIEDVEHEIARRSQAPLTR